MNKFFGKYRGKVVNNMDPKMMGRVQVSCPAVLGQGQLSWAMPCSPYGGSGVGLFAVPPVGANVWVEFEGGDPDYPILGGCFWGLGEVPASPALPTTKVLKTDGVTVTIDDLPGAGSLTIEVAPPVVAMPLKVVFDSNGIEITDSPASVKITPENIEISHSPSTVTIAPDAIEVANSPSTIKIEAAGVETSNSPSAMKVASSGIEMSNSSAEAKVASSGVELKNGSASVNLSAASVNVNNGALEVI